MLSLDTPMEIGGIVVYRDHNDPRSFYYVPGSPRIAKTGNTLEFRLIVYRTAIEERGEDDAPGGGFLNLTVDLGLDRGKRQQLEDELKRRVRGGDFKLSPLPLEEGSVRLSTLGFQQGQEEGEGSLFVENVIGAARPALYGDNRATFAIELSHRGALLLKEAIENPGALPVSIVYDLQFRGMLPSYRANITINFSQTYEYMRSRFQANTLVFKADIDNEFEELQRREAIVIEQEDFRGLEPDAVAAERLRLEELAKELAAGNFFRPTLNPGTVLASDRGTMDIYDATSDAVRETAGFTTPLVLTMPTAEGGGDSNVVTGSSDASGGLGGASVEGGSGSASGGSGGGSGSGDGGGTTTREPTAVERWNQAGRPQAGYMLKSLEQRELRTVTYETKGSSAVVRNIAPQGTITLLKGSADPKSIVLVADLDDPFFQTIEGKIRTNADLDSRGISSMVVEVRYGVDDEGRAPKDMAEAMLRTTDDEKDYRFAVDSRASRELDYRVTLNHVDGFALGGDSTKTVSNWVTTTTRFLELDPAAFDPMAFARVEVGRVDWEQARLFEGAVVFGDERRAFKLDPQTSSIDVVVRHGSAEPDWKVEGTWHYTDGTRREVASSVKRGTDAVLLDANPDGVTELRVELLDPLGRYDKALVEVSAGEGDGARTKVFELSPANPSVQWSVPNPESGDPVEFSYDVTAFFTDGTVDKKEGRTADRQLLVGDVFNFGMLEIEVHVVADFAVDQLRAVQLSLTYPDAPAGITAKLDKAFMSSPIESLRWRVPRGGPGKDTYEWTVSWIYRNGKRLKVGPTSTNEGSLLLLPEPMPE